MLFFITLITVFNIIIAFEPSCTSCKHFIPHHLENNEFGMCELFKSKCYYNDKEYVLPNFATHCRINESLCGKSGILYEPIENNNNQNFETEIQNEFNELNNRCCGEVNEKDEIEQLEKEFFEVFQKIKKHNKKRIYKTTKDIFKLFKRSN
jgi:hypothetical protein